MTERGAPMASIQRCTACGAEHPEAHLAPHCATCGGLLDLVHPAPGVQGAALAAALDARASAWPGKGLGEGRGGVWRYRELILPNVAPGDIVSWPEGDTPLLTQSRIAQWAGVPGLLLKHDGLNPTGSFKDRGMTVAITQARRMGVRAVACASTGNTGASLAAYAAQAGIPALVIIPEGQVALGKLTQTLAYGARTLLVRGDFDDCLRLAGEASERLGVYLMNSVNPFRLEGQKTAALEIVQQLAWSPPDWIVLPAGNLGNTAAYGKALREALAWGLIDRVPRLAAVQAAGAAPFARAFAGGFAERVRVRASTVATAINIGDPASYDRAVRVIRETDGIVLAVDDAEILAAKAVIDAAGVGCEPASAASVAGVRALAANGHIGPNDRVVAALTGHLLKDPGILLDFHVEREPAPAGANRPETIATTVSAVERVLAGMGALPA